MLGPPSPPSLHRAGLSPPTSALSAAQAALAAMAAHGASAGVQEMGAGLLRAIASAGAAEKALVSAEGGTAAVLAALRAHAADAAVAAQCLEAIWALAGLPANKASILRAGGLDASVAAMEAHPSAEGVQARGVGAVWSLVAPCAAVAGTDNVTARPGGRPGELQRAVGALEAAQRAFPEASQVQTYAAAALRDIREFA